MKLKTISTLIFTALVCTTMAQEKPADTVIVPLANSSKVILVVKDRADLDILKHYDFQELFQDVIKKLEDADTSRQIDVQQTIPVAQYEDTPEENWESENNDDDDDDNWDRNRIGRTWQSFNIDLGTNNFLQDGQFPDGSENYAVRPWGSWYVGLTSIQRTRLGNHVFMEWGLGVNWYNFKFERDNIRMRKDEMGVYFEPDSSAFDFIKSKLSATYLQASLIPVLDFGDHRTKPRMWDGEGSDFRLGFGPYVAYRIASKSKLVYEENGEREKDKNRDSYYLNNLRYGLRLQLGFRSTDFFVNYDLNDTFAANKGPKLNAVSFGVIF